MLLFYAATNMYILNAVNVKCNYFPNCSADLYVVDSARISPTLISNIEKLNIFKSVIHVSIPELSIPNFAKDKRYIRPIYRFFHIIKTIPRINSILKVNTQRKSYSHLFVNHFNGYDNLTVLNNLKKHILEVSFIEEGSGDLYKDESLIYGFIPELRVADNIIYIIMGWSVKRKEIPQLMKNFYFYVPELYSTNDDIERLNLPQINSKNIIPYQLLLDETSFLDISEYQQRRYVYFSSAEEMDNNCKNLYIQVNTLMSVVPHDNIIIKAHPRPSNNVNSVDDPYMIYKNKIYVDERNYLLESIYSRIDPSDKVFITYKSATVLHPKYMFGKEPHIIFTFNLNKTETNYFNDRVVDDLKSEYSNKEKILVPNTIEEFKSMLKKIEMEGNPV